MLKSRGYRIRLSHKGVEAYLTCNYRLGSITRSFVPYGNTLFVAILLAEKVELESLAETMDLPHTRAMRGKGYYYVGMPEFTHDLVYQMINGLGRFDPFRQKLPRPTEFYVGAIAVMQDTHDLDILKAYERMLLLMDEAEKIET